MKKIHQIWFSRFFLFNSLSFLVPQKVHLILELLFRSRKWNPSKIWRKGSFFSVFPPFSIVDSDALKISSDSTQVFLSFYRFIVKRIHLIRHGFSSSFIIVRLRPIRHAFLSLFCRYFVGSAWAGTRRRRELLFIAEQGRKVRNEKLRGCPETFPARAQLLLMRNASL